MKISSLKNFKLLNSSKSAAQNTEWHLQICSALQAINIECDLILEDNFHILIIGDNRIILNLMSLDYNAQPSSLISLQQTYADKGIKLIHLWEDVWLSNATLVIARIHSLLGLNKKIHGRKTAVKKITKPIADLFLTENHLQGTVSSRYKIGLFVNEDLMAVATFSALRKMNHTENYKSAELIRFAVKSGNSISGGLSKLINSFYKTYQSNDLMTYADLDWSAGEAYLKLKFIQTDILQPQYFILDQDLSRVLIKDNSSAKPKVFNTGSIKFILKF